MRYMAIKLPALALLGALALTGCVTTNAIKGDGSNVALNQTAYVDGPRIRPIAVLEDSRCPINARCVWAGRVRVKVLWMRTNGTQELELTMGEAKTMADGAITLTSVTPGRVAGGSPILPKDYRFSFTFAGGL